MRDLSNLVALSARRFSPEGDDGSWTRMVGNGVNLSIPRSPKEDHQKVPAGPVDPARTAPASTPSARTLLRAIPERRALGRALQRGGDGLWPARFLAANVSRLRPYRIAPRRQTSTGSALAGRHGERLETRAWNRTKREAPCTALCVSAPPSGRSEKPVDGRRFPTAARSAACSMSPRQPLQQPPHLRGVPLTNAARSADAALVERLGDACKSRYAPRLQRFDDRVELCRSFVRAHRANFGGGAPAHYFDMVTVPRHDRPRLTAPIA
jgi:hypothetical protein